MSGPTFDDRFNDLCIEISDVEECEKDKLLNVLEAGISPDKYITMEQLQQEFSLPRYEITKRIKKLGAQPIGMLINVGDDGRRKRGVGKYVYDIAIVDEIRDYITGEIDMDEIKRKAAALLQQE